MRKEGRLVRGVYIPSLCIPKIVKSLIETRVG